MKFRLKFKICFFFDLFLNVICIMFCSYYHFVSIIFFYLFMIILNVMFYFTYDFYFDMIIVHFICLL